MSLEDQELIYLKNKIGRKLTSTEIQIVAAEWSEHCSYKSSKKHLKLLPMIGPNVIKEKGLDSGVLDVGDGYVVTVHIESHNHPSAVEPYGGAATGVGGVIRDILSAGTRPIAILDGLRFGDIKKDPHARWLFKNAVRGIADYGNCLGIPTIGGEVEFDDCYSSYALVDVAAIGFGKKEHLIKNKATKNDLVLLIGGYTGRDGIGGSQFASDSLESENRSAVQIPDPFIEKLIIETILEANKSGCIKAMKDLGGGGLSCAISETADSLSVGIELDVNKIHAREPDMTPDELMVSESQERMLVVTDSKRLKKLENICARFRVRCSVIGKVTGDKIMHVKKEQSTFAKLPTEIVANAPLLDRTTERPKYLEKLPKKEKFLPTRDYADVIMKLLTSPNIASKNWVFEQYDHEVGIRTVVKPGYGASVLRLDNGKFLSVKIDGNPKQCYIDPLHGAIGCFEEACRNVVCTGAAPIGMVDHLQFGNPENPEIFWTFKESLNGIADFAKFFKIPCVGGKVSFYNETPHGPIKPTPLIGVLGLIEKRPLIPQQLVKGDVLVLIGNTKDELGGSEYSEYIHSFTGGQCPQVDFETSLKNMNVVLDLIKNDFVKYANDCSKGGLAVGISEICMINDIGCIVTTEKIPTEISDVEKILFSESHSRYLLVIERKKLNKFLKFLKTKGVDFGLIGEFEENEIIFERNTKRIVAIRVQHAKKKWMNALEEIIQHG